MRPRINSAATVRTVTMLGFASALACLALLALAGVAGADAITPESGPTQNAKDTDTLFKIVLVAALVVIGLVWGLLFYSLVRYRGSREGSASQIRGNTALELGWTIAPIVVVTAIILLSVVMLPDIKNPAASGPSSVAQAKGQFASIDQPAPPKGKGLSIKVSGQQYLWRYQYPNGAVAFHDMVVPKDTTVLLDIETTDVAHSWWIPKLGGKFDALPGLNNETWFKATETGTFDGQCAELCGSNHAVMTARVIVVEPAQYTQWVAQQKTEIDEARTQQQKQSKQFAKEDV